MKRFEVRLRNTQKPMIFEAERWEQEGDRIYFRTSTTPLPGDAFVSATEIVAIQELVADKQMVTLNRPLRSKRFREAFKRNIFSFLCILLLLLSYVVPESLNGPNILRLTFSVLAFAVAIVAIILGIVRVLERKITVRFKAMIIAGLVFAGFIMASFLRESYKQNVSFGIGEEVKLPHGLLLGQSIEDLEMGFDMLRTEGEDSFSFKVLIANWKITAVMLNDEYKNRTIPSHVFSVRKINGIVYVAVGFNAEKMVSGVEPPLKIWWARKSYLK